MNKIDFFCKICNLNPRDKSHYKAKFNKYDKLNKEEILQEFEKRKSIKTTYYIYQILDELENQIQENNDLRKEKEELINNKSIETKKRHQQEIDSLNKKINEFKNYTEDNWRKITNIFRRYIIENHGEEEYEQLVDEELQDLKVIPRPDNTGRNIKSYHGL